MILSWQKTEELLKKYQIPLVESLLIETAEQGIEFAHRVGWPVVLKLLLPDDLHKTDKGLVKLNLQNEQQLASACAEIEAVPRGLTPGQLLVQKQVSGVELFLGMKRDQSFGPAISFGLGGIFVEVLGDVVFGICPVDQKYALQMIKDLKGYKILQGYRGQTPINLEKLADVLVNVSKLAVENKEISEIDFNPILADGNNIIVADAKII
ncbi:MAG: acetate--CoA ligase family protein [Patescibacteria group bacterium]